MPDNKTVNQKPVSVKGTKLTPQNTYTFSTRIASGDWNHQVQIWDANNGKQLYAYTKHSDYIESVAWSPDGKKIASASRDATVQIWQAS